MSSAHLSRRERQIMDILHRRGRATVAEVMSELSGEPAYSTVRAQLRVLEEKGHIRHEEEQLRYVYLPAQSHRVASRSALGTCSTPSFRARRNRSSKRCSARTARRLAEGARSYCRSRGSCQA